MSEMIERRKEARHTNLILITIIVIMGATVLLLAVQTYRTALGSDQLLEYSVCTAEDFADDQSCEGDPPVDPDVLVLSEDLAIDVAGEVKFSGDEAVTYQVQVFWVNTTGGSRYTLIDVEITYDPDHADSSYAIPWVAPNQLLAIAERQPPCTDLGRWRIVGRASPIDNLSVSPYNWDSVETFGLVTPGCND